VRVTEASEDRSAEVPAATAPLLLQPRTIDTSRAGADGVGEPSRRTSGTWPRRRVYAAQSDDDALSRTRGRPIGNLIYGQVTL